MRAIINENPSVQLIIIYDIHRNSSILNNIFILSYNIYLIIYLLHYSIFDIALRYSHIDIFSYYVLATQNYVSFQNVFKTKIQF